MEKGPGSLYEVVEESERYMNREMAIRQMGSLRLKRNGVSSVIGLKLIHTPGDSERATRQIDVEMQSIVDSMYLAMGVEPSLIRRYSLDDVMKLSPSELAQWRDAVIAAKQTASQSPLWGFWISVVAPIFSEWMKFRGEQEFYNLFTSWEEYEKWLERVRLLRAAVLSKGVTLESPAPSDLTKTLGQAGLEKLDELYGVLKILAVIAAIAIGGLIIVTAIKR